MKTIVYVDGFNFYYGACRANRVRWVDLHTLVQRLLPGHQIVAIRYFSAEIKSDPRDPDKLNRQRLYFRALRTLPNLDIQLGSFLESVKRMVCFPVTTPPRMVEVLRMEEKGSDVNLATALLLDAFDRRMECAVLVSNDSDLLTPILTVRQRFRLKVGILNPQKRPSVVLSRNVDFYKQVRRGVLLASQFPVTLTDANGPFHKPAAW